MTNDSATAPLGLSIEAARTALERVGPNELRAAPQPGAVRQFLAQLKSPMILLLIAAAAVSGFLGDVAEAIAIAAIVLLNAVVGYAQEHRAHRAVLAMRKLTAPRARVLRGGRTEELAARDVVPGDVLVLDAGDVVAADAVLFEVNTLSTNEAALTGESAPVEKSIEPAEPNAPLAEQRHRVFMGTAVANGSGKAVVQQTGPRTELGKIAQLLEAVGDEDTPLQVQLAGVGKALLVVCLGIVAVVAVLGLARGEPPVSLLVASISLAVAAIPEGLPAIVTIALAIGVQRLAARRVLVRHLPAVETLGSATVIATDKTGTLTTGEMTVREVWPPGDATHLLQIAAGCCDAELHADGTGVGDTTELAILREARARGISREQLEQTNPRVTVHPFDSIRKRMSILRADGVLAVKGAVDLLLPLCTAGTEGALEANAAMAGRGLRVLAVASGLGEREEALTLLGLVGLADPPRPEATEAIEAARRAGIRIVMMTGDHPTTAEAIAREMGLVTAAHPISKTVFARVTPEEKLRIVQALKADGEVVAMTGDGVNDAPSLKEAHLGIAMGKTGAEVTREAADMVLTDDNFASIIAAVREGRGIYDNIQKALVYMLGGNAAELLVVLGAALLGLPTPLLPLHLLWVNLVTDGLPALALVMEPTTDEVLQRAPRSPTRRILARAEWVRIGVIGLLVGAPVLSTFGLELTTETLPHARGLAFNALVFAQAFLVFASRSFGRTSFEVGTFTNPRLLAVVALTCALQLALVAMPFTNRLLDLGPFSWSLTLLAIGIGLGPVTVLELWKLIARRWAKRG